MDEGDNSLDQPLGPEDSSLESQSQAVVSSGQLHPPRLHQRLSPFRFNRRALVLTLAAIGVLSGLVLGGLYLSGSFGKSAGGNKAASYPVGDLKLEGVKPGSDLQLGGAQYLAVNGELRVANSLVISPSDQPAKPATGQIYFDKNANSLYLYVGNTLKNFAFTDDMATVGGQTGNIGVGEGLGLNGGTLSNTGVLSLQGQTGNLSLAAGNGIAINGLNIANNGVLTLTGTANQIGVSAATGSITLSLPQDIGATSMPTFAGLNLQGGSGFLSSLTSTSLSANRAISLPDEGGVVCLQNSPNCGFGAGSGAAFVNNGNSFGSLATLGTNDGFDLILETNGSEKLRVTTDGNVGLGTTGPVAKLEVQGGSSGSTPTVPGAFGPTASTAKISNGSIWLPNAASLYFGNAAGTSFQPILTRASSNFTELRAGSGDTILTGDTSQRIGIGKLNTTPSAIDTTVGAIVLHNADAAGVTRVTVRAGAGQGTNSIFRVQDFTGNELLQVASSGNLGIGTASPGVKLDVVQTAAAQTPGIQFTNTSNAAAATAELRAINDVGAQALFGITSSTNTNNYGIPTASTAFIRSSSATNGLTFVLGDASDPFIFRAGSNELARITGAGNVGIGVTNPNSRLNVGGLGESGLVNTRPDAIWTTSTAAQNTLGVTAADQAEVIWKDSGGPVDRKIFQAYSSDGNLGFRSVNDALSVKNETLFLQHDGNVGIGDTNPSTRLSLGGTGSANGITLGDDAADLVNLYRSAAETLQTDDALTVGQLLTGQLGAAISGATINLNASSNFATNINTGTSTGAVTIGNGAAGAITLQSGSSGGNQDIILNSADTIELQDNTNVTGTLDVSGRAAFGAGASVSTSRTVNIVETRTDTSGEQDGIYSNVVANPSANSSGLTIAGYFQANSQSGNTRNFTGGLTAIQGDAQHLGSGTIANLQGLRGTAYNLGSNTITNAYGVTARTETSSGGGAITNAHGLQAVVGTSFGGGAITNAYGLSIYSAFQSGGTISNNYGIYIQDQSGVGSTISYNLYSAGANAKNYFEGKLQVGSSQTGSRINIGIDSDTTAAGGILFGTDTNLYRSAANQLQTDDGFTANSLTAASLTGVGSLTLNGDTERLQFSSIEHRITIDPLPGDGTSPAFVDLFRSTNTTGSRQFRIFKGDGTATTTFQVSADNGAITLQGDTNLYRSAANQLQTDDALVVVGTFQVDTLGASTGATSLCRNTSNQLSSCGANPDSVSLQQAYDADADGSDATIALTATDDSLVIQNPASGGTDSSFALKIDQLATGAVEGLRVESAGTGNLLTIRDTTATAQDVLTIANGGATTFRNHADSTAAFQIQNAASTSNLFVANTTNGRIGIGTASPGEALDVNGNIKITGTSSNYLVGPNNVPFNIRAGNANDTSDGLSFAVDTDTGAGTSYTTALTVTSSGITFGPVSNPMNITGPAQRQLVIRGGDLNDMTDDITFQIDTDTSGTTSYANVLTVDAANSGSIGIGTVSPTAVLHVSRDGTADLFKVTDATATAVDVMKIADGGAATFRNQTDSTTAFQIQNVASNVLLNVNTSDSFVINNGTTALGNQLENPGFEAAGGSDVSGWTITNGSITTDSVNAHSGNRVGTLTAAAGEFVPTKYYQVVGGQDYYVSEWVKNSSGGATANASIGIFWYNKDKGLISASTTTIGTVGTTYTFKDRLATAPSTAVYAKFVVGNGTGATGTLYVDDVAFAPSTNPTPTTFKNNLDSTTAFQIQNSGGQQLLVADTSSQRIAIGPAAVPANGVLTIGTNTTAASGGIYFGTDTNLYRSAADTLATDDDLLVNRTSNTAFKIQSTAPTALFTADTSGMVIKVSGTTTTFATLQIENAHFKSTQTTAPTIGTPTSCGTAPSAAVAAGATDAAGSFTITAGTITPTTCDTVITFNKTYGAAPKSVIITAKGSATASARQIYVSASSATTFTVRFGTSPGSEEANEFYYWVVE